MCAGLRSVANRTKTFWFYFGIRLPLTFFSAIVTSLFDVTSVSTLARVNGNLVLQRFWATISVCVFAPFVGYLLDRKSKEKPSHDYSISFYMYSVFYLAAALISVFVDFSLKKSYNTEKKTWKMVLGDYRQLFLIVNLLVLGVFWGCIDNYLFLYMKSELGANHLILGLTGAIGAFVSVPVTPFITWIISKTGYANVITLAFLAYTIKFLCYYLLKSASWYLTLEVLNVFTISLLVSGAVLYSSKCSNTSTVTTAVALWNGSHFIIGRTLGAVVSGLASSRWGFRRVFLAYSYLAAILTLLVLTIQFLLKKCTKPIKDTDSENSYSSDEHVEDKSRHSADLSTLVLPFLESTGLSPFHVAWVLKGDRRPTLAEEVRRRSGAQDDFSFFYCLGGGGGSATHRMRRKSFPAGVKGNPAATPNSRRASAVSFRISLAPVPEEETGSFTPECPKKPSSRYRLEVKDLGIRGEPEGCENPAFEEDTVA